VACLRSSCDDDDDESKDPNAEEEEDEALDKKPLAIDYASQQREVTRFKEDWIDSMFAPVVGQT
jgi:hypothetical protein